MTVVVVVASGDLVPGDLDFLDGADRVVAADGGAAAIERSGRRVDLLVGDLDSVAPELVERLVAAGTRVERHPVDKDASDTELALRAAVATGAERVIVLGAFGGDRIDHELATVLLLADPDLGSTDVRLVRGDSIVRTARGPATIGLEAGPGGIVTLLPIGGDADGVSTTGLRWRLEGATLRMGASRGLSNELVADPAAVRVERGTLLVVETISRGART